MAFVINLADAIGREYYLSVPGKMVPMDQPSQEEPKVFTHTGRIEKLVKSMSETYPATCQVYALERKEFEKRRQLLQNPPQPKTKKKK
ncbi:hypothetical protein GCM10023189_32680 [Nibrella saemangeumensis]|uniref:Uncharacterized protein n=1 Tax=Nibrella saemangeumensis TaxID=1084526 RepID=A0ABP8N3A5_9BACT